MRDKHPNAVEDRPRIQVRVSGAIQTRVKTKDRSQPGGWVCALFGRYSPSSRKRGVEARASDDVSAKRRGVGQRASAAEARFRHAERLL